MVRGAKNERKTFFTDSTSTKKKNGQAVILKGREMKKFSTKSGRNASRDEELTQSVAVQPVPIGFELIRLTLD